VADFILTKLAQRDLVKALRWSRETFGDSQTVTYAGQMRVHLSSLAESPNPGTPYRAKAGMYWLLSGSHVVFYRAQPRLHRARVVRILHRSRLPSLHLL